MIVRYNGKQKTLDKRLKSKTFCARVVYATLLATYAGTRHDYVRRLRITYVGLGLRTRRCGATQGLYQLGVGLSSNTKMS